MYAHKGWGITSDKELSCGI